MKLFGLCEPIYPATILDHLKFGVRWRNRASAINWLSTPGADETNPHPSMTALPYPPRQPPIFTTLVVAMARGDVDTRLGEAIQNPLIMRKSWR